MTHAVVWIDHKEARIFHVHPEAADESTILSPQRHIHRHPKGRGEPREHPDDARHFFDDVARGLDGVDSVLVVGPASAKHDVNGPVDQCVGTSVDGQALISLLTNKHSPARRSTWLDTH